MVFLMDLEGRDEWIDGSEEKNGNLVVHKR